MVLPYSKPSESKIKICFTQAKSTDECIFQELYKRPAKTLITFKNSY